jgi:hypothetical protein
VSALVNCLVNPGSPPHQGEQDQPCKGKPHEALPLAKGPVEWLAASPTPQGEGGKKPDDNDHQDYLLYVLVVHFPSLAARWLPAIDGDREPDDQQGDEAADRPADSGYPEESPFFWGPSEPMETFKKAALAAGTRFTKAKT